MAGDVEKGKEYIQLGERAGEQIEDKDNREYFFSELRGVSELLE